MSSSNVISSLFFLLLLFNFTFAPLPNRAERATTNSIDSFLSEFQTLLRNVNRFVQRNGLDLLPTTAILPREVLDESQTNLNRLQIFCRHLHRLRDHVQERQEEFTLIEQNALSILEIILQFLRNIQDRHSDSLSFAVQSVSSSSSETSSGKLCTNINKICIWHCFACGKG